MSNIRKFEEICGDCTGLNVNAITENDVRMQAIEWTHSDDQMPTEADIEDAILGLYELRELQARLRG